MGGAGRGRHRSQPRGEGGRARAGGPGVGGGRSNRCRLSYWAPPSLPPRPRDPRSSATKAKPSTSSQEMRLSRSAGSAFFARREKVWRFQKQISWLGPPELAAAAAFPGSAAWRPAHPARLADLGPRAKGDAAEWASLSTTHVGPAPPQCLGAPPPPRLRARAPPAAPPP